MPWVFVSEKKKKCMYNFCLLTNNVYIYLVRNSMTCFIVSLCLSVCICVCLYVCPYICPSVKKGNISTHNHIMTQSDALKINSCRKHCKKKRNCL